jgi:prepilin-type N-terminal cleavage/methylation domain-containing protein
MKSASGFTLMELIVTVIVFSVLALISISSSLYLTEKNEQQKIVDALRTIVQYAKIQAIQLGNPVYLLPLDPKSDWSKGLMLSSKNKTSHQMETLYQWQWHHPRWNLLWSGVHYKDKITFSNNPITAMSNGTFHLTNKRTQQGVDIVLNRLGRVRT